MLNIFPYITYILHQTKSIAPKLHSRISQLGTYTQKHPHFFALIV